MSRQLSIQERDCIAQWRARGFNQREIATRLGRARSTVCRELRRNATDGEYLAAQAHCQSQRRRRERPLVRKMGDTKINALVQTGLGRDFAPEQIAGRMKQQAADATAPRISAQTIYTWIEQSPDRAHWKSHLRRRGKRPARRKNADPSAKSRIQNRPEVIEQRIRFGDWEGDTVLGPPGTGGLVTLVDRKSRFTIIAKIQSKDADHVQATIRDRLKELAAEQRRSITFDNGKEFARCHRLEKHLDMQLYFADPGCPYQRGTNENTNGLIRQYFPKGTDFSTVSHQRVREVENLLNDRPRACLGFRTPREVSSEQDPPAGCD